jgi:hypothetical protein
MAAPRYDARDECDFRIGSMLPKKCSTKAVNNEFLLIEITGRKQG